MRVPPVTTLPSNCRRRLSDGVATCRGGRHAHTGRMRGVPGYRVASPDRPVAPDRHQGVTMATHHPLSTDRTTATPTWLPTVAKGRRRRLPPRRDPGLRPGITTHTNDMTFASPRQRRRSWASSRCRSLPTSSPAFRRRRPACLADDRELGPLPARRRHRLPGAVALRPVHRQSTAPPTSSRSIAPTTGCTSSWASAWPCSARSPAPVQGATAPRPTTSEPVPAQPG